ncbi:MAG: hypothetical protein N4A45_07890 [Flavobacteriales bacterium]|jgi:hypothetical protein|nr:hypothetical protein [Flavobacteriales bacterium]
MKKYLLSTFLLLGVFMSFAQEKAYLTTASGDGLDHSTKRSISKIFSLKMKELNKYTIVFEDQIVPLTKEKIRAKAQEKKIPYYIVSEVNAIGNTYYLSYVLFKTETNKLVREVTVKSLGSNNIDEKLDEAVSELSGVKRVNDIYSVTEDEAQPLRKRSGNRGFGVRLGAANTFVDSKDDKDFNHFSSGIGFSYGVDGGNYLMDVNFMNFFGDNISMRQFSLNYYKTLSSLNNSWYWGAGVSYTGMDIRRRKVVKQNSNFTAYNFEYDENSGFGLRGHFGYILNRTHKNHIMIGVAPYITTFRVHDYLRGGAELYFSVTF